MSIEPVNNPLSKLPSDVPLLPNEAERLIALQSYHILDTAEEEDFDELTALASAICQTPVALITFVDKDRQWFKSHHGTEVTETPKSFSFCAHAIASPNKIMIVEDTAADVRFAENPLVTGEPHVAFYAGVPLIDKQGFGLGTICVVDTQIRELNESQINALLIIGKQVVDRLELRRRVLELEIANRKLNESDNRFRRLISQAPVAIAIYAGGDFVIEQANQQMLDIIGRGAEIIGLPLIVARPELLGHPYMNVLNGVFTSGKQHTGDAVLVPVLRNGEVKNGYFDVSYKPIRNEAGEVISVMVVAADVTEKVLLGQRAAELNEELMAMNEELVCANDELIESKEELAAMNEELVSANIELLQSKEDLLAKHTELSASESRFRDLVNQSPVAMAIYSGDDLIIENANAPMLKIWGRSADIIGQKLLVARPEIKDNPFVGLLKGIFETGETKNGYGVKGPVIYNGQMQDRYFDATYKPIIDDKGKVTGVIAVATDITDKYLAEEREAEFKEELAVMNEELVSANQELGQSKDELITIIQELAESEMRVRNIIVQAPVAIATLKGRDMVIDQVNDMILKLWGKDSSVVGKPLAIALPELEGQPFLQILNDVFTSGQPYFGNEAKVSLEYEGGLQHLFVNFVYQPIKNGNGVTTDIIAVANDVTEQVNARKAIEEVNLRLNIALDASGLGSTEVDLATGIMTSTRQFKKIFGRAEHETFNYPDLFDTMLPEYRDEIRRRVKEAIDTNGIYHAEYQVQWPDGSIHWISAHGRPRYDDNGKAIRMVGMTSDITEQRLQDQRKDDFLSIASHELKTPTTSLKAALQLLNLIKDKPMSPMHVRLIEQSNRSMDKMTALIDDLLNVHRMQGGQLTLDESTFTLSELLNGCCGHVRLAGKHELIFEGDEDLQVHADEHRIEQVVVNFVNNAIKYAPDSREIYLGAYKLDGFAKVSVRDNGPGIPLEKQPYLFDRYYRADHSGPTYTGLGLGLYICAEIIKRHGGEVGVDSEVGKGSTFWFTLPI